MGVLSPEVTDRAGRGSRRNSSRREMSAGVQPGNWPGEDEMEEPKSG